MRVLVSGSSGLVGSVLLTLLDARGIASSRLVRRRSDVGQADISWDPETGAIDRDHLDGFDAVVHLAGENIAAGRWTEKQKHRIRSSRVEGTRFLCHALARLEQPPGVLVCASATGFYGDRGTEWLDESASPGNGFLSEVCQAWEQAADPAREAGIRVVNLRFGIVLSAAGGALAKMLLPFRFGLGGRVGSGRQYWSWISIEDVVEVICQSLSDRSLVGPVNTVSPKPVTNSEFTRALGKVLRRPTVMPLPAPMARLVLGQMADELLLASARVRPSRLSEVGYRFRHPELEPAIQAALGR